MVRRTVYAARPLRILPEGVAEALAEGEIGAALFYSAETAQAFIRLKPWEPGYPSICAQRESCCCAGWLALERDPCRISAD